MNVCSNFSKDLMNLQNKIGIITRAAGLEYKNYEEESSLYEELEKISSQTPPILFSHVDQLDLLNRISSKYFSIKTILLLLQNTELSKIAKQIIDIQHLRCFIISDLDNLNFKSLLTVLRKLAQNDIFGLEKYMNCSTQIQETKIYNKVDKNALLESIFNYIENLGRDNELRKFARYARKIVEAIDEILLNAIFDANPRYENSPRGDDFRLTEIDRVMVKWGFDGELFGVSVEDKFGRLKKNTVIKYIDDSLEQSEVRTETNCGIGLKSAFKKMDDFIVNIKDKEKTEIILLHKIMINSNKMDTKKCSFHYYSV